MIALLLSTLVVAQPTDQQIVDTITKFNTQSFTKLPMLNPSQRQKLIKGSVVKLVNKGKNDKVLSWDLPFSSSDAGFLLTDANVEVDATVSEGGWECTLKRPESLWTWYAEYQDLLHFQCSGSSDMQFFFGKRAGLILLLMDGKEIELVAPW